MVEFYDSIAKQTISYHIPPVTKKVWDKLRGGGLEKLNEDRVYLVDGREGTGKSSFAFQQAKYLNPKFNIDFICFNAKQFLDKLRTAPTGSVIVFDEAFRGLSSKGTRSKVNKEIVEALMEVRQRNFIIFIVLPTLFLLELYAAVFRSEGLLHVYKLKKTTADGARVRGVRVYNYEKKKQLYLRGKTKYFSYAYPRIKKARGEFYVKKNKRFPTGTPYETFELKEYLKLKAEAFRKKEKEVSTAEAKYLNQRNLIIKKLYDEVVKSYRKLSKWLLEAGVDITPTHTGRIVGKTGKISETVT